jgi:hypothetical protein
MPLGEIPLWGQWGLLGFSMGLVLFFMVQFIRGELVSRKQLEDAQRASDSWQHAWEVSQQTNHEVVALLGQLTVTTQTMERVLNALPPAQTARVVVVHDEESR